MSVAVEQPDTLFATEDPPVRVTPSKFPARVVPNEWAATSTSPEHMLARLTSVPFVLERPDKQAKRVNGIKALINWLADQPGRTWQERWLSSGADAADAAWREVSTR